MPIAPWYVVPSPKTSGPLNSLLASGNLIDERDTRWEAGFTFVPENCGQADCWSECQERDANCDTVDHKEDCPDCDLSEIKYNPFTVVSTYTCRSSVSNDYDFYVRKVKAKLEVEQYKAIEREFWTGSCNPDNQHLDEPVVAATPTDPPRGATILAGGLAQDPHEALAILVQALANCGPGGRGMIHGVPQFVQSVSHILGDFKDGHRTMLVTKAGGHIVVSGAGYPGTGPGGITPAPGTAWVYATRIPDIRLGQVEIIPSSFAEAFDRRTNKVTVRAERVVGVVHDECCHFAILVDLCKGEGN